jgi:hypothetical protein
MLGLSINGARNRGGLVGYLPAKGNSVIQILRDLGGWGTGSVDGHLFEANPAAGEPQEALLLLPHWDFCSLAPSSRPEERGIGTPGEDAACSFNGGSGALRSNGSSGVVLWGTLPCTMDTSIVYQVRPLTLILGLHPYNTPYNMYSLYFIRWSLFKPASCNPLP